MSSRKNKWRTRGVLQFKRETRRYHDGTPWGGDVLFIRIKGKACVFAYGREKIEAGQYDINRPGKIWFHAGNYHCESPVKAAHIMRAELYYQEARHAKRDSMGNRIDGLADPLA